MQCIPRVSIHGRATSIIITNKMATIHQSKACDRVLDNNKVIMQSYSQRQHCHPRPQDLRTRMSVELLAKCSFRSEEVVLTDKKAAGRCSSAQKSKGVSRVTE